MPFRLSTENSEKTEKNLQTPNFHGKSKKEYSGTSNIEFLLTEGSGNEQPVDFKMEEAPSRNHSSIGFGKSG